jgi:nucleotide-binding universal stress UspA family protein
MNAFKNIIVPTDFSEPAAQAMETAIGIAAAFRASLTLVHVAWTPPTAYVGYVEGFYWPVDDRDVTRKALDEQLVKARAQYPSTEGIIVDGESWRAILQAAKDKNADLIVMGTHGRTGIARVFLGSVAERIVRLSPIPVLTVSGKSEQLARAKTMSELSERGAA